MNNIPQKGVSILFAILILSVVLSIALGLTTIVVTQIRTIKNIGDSVIAFYAADAGVEYMLKIIIRGDTPLSSYPTVYLDSPRNTISYDINVVCCGSGTKCTLIGSCPLLSPPDNNCTAPRYCVKSVGTYSSTLNQTKKAIEVEI